MSSVIVTDGDSVRAVLGISYQVFTFIVIKCCNDFFQFPLSYQYLHAFLQERNHNRNCIMCPLSA